MGYLDAIFEKAQGHLVENEKALRYLISRGVSKEQVLELGLGYIPEEEWPPFIKEKDASPEELFYWDRSRKGSRLKGKLLFPMTNAMGAIRGFQIRTPDTEVKDYWKFYDLHADIDGLFFGTKPAMKSIWEKREVVLVEGIFDIFPVQRVFPNTISTGTANLSANQIEFLLRYVDRVLVMFDNDSFGDDFWNHFSKHHRRDFQDLTKISYSGKDPSESWKALGEARFKAQLEPYLHTL